jgi:4a-hydroxytetrahydrobiopterin dehydratase
MTEALASKTCIPCRGGIPPLTREQAELFHAQAPDWQLAEEAHRIERSFRFRNFREPLTFLPNIPRINSRLRSLEAYTQTITAPPPRHYR